MADHTITILAPPSEFIKADFACNFAAIESTLAEVSNPATAPSLFTPRAVAAPRLPRVLHGYSIPLIEIADGMAALEGIAASSNLGGILAGPFAAISRSLS